MDAAKVLEVGPVPDGWPFKCDACRLRVSVVQIEIVASQGMDLCAECLSVAWRALKAASEDYG
jgi:hypothetical protein